jgi:aryl-alcohol dehydrogenase-like predicted oxidoreductase
MEYRTLGRSGLRISTLVLGTMTFGGRGKFSDVGATQVDEAASIVKTAVDAGVNMIDTADVYSGGRSEEIVGQILPSYGEDLLVATKVRFPMGAGPNDAGLSRHHIVRAAEASLRRLGRDHIDLYQVHEWDGITPVEETLDALDTLVHQGKVRYVGCSNYAAWQLMKALGASDRLGLQRFVSQQVYCSLLGRELEQELIPAAIDQGLGVLVWSPPHHGVVRTAGPRLGPDLRHHRRRGRGGRGPGGVGGPGGPGLAAGPAGRDRAGDRGPHRGAADRQPGGGRPGPAGRRASEARRGVGRAAGLPVLAPGHDRGRPPRAVRPHPRRSGPLTAGLHRR